MKNRSTRKLLASAVLSAGMLLSTGAGCDGVRNQRSTTSATTVHEVATPRAEAAVELVPTPAPITAVVSSPPVEPAPEPAVADPSPAPADNAAPADAPAIDSNAGAAGVETEYPACPITGNSKRPAYDQATYAECVEATRTGDATDA